MALAGNPGCNRHEMSRYAVVNCAEQPEPESPGALTIQSDSEVSAAAPKRPILEKCS